MSQSRSWIDDLVLQHSELESPLSFWFWGGIVALSAVIKDNIWIDRHIHKLYPNIYVMLHAESGLKKGPPISMAKQLVQLVGNTRVITGRSSIQGILKDMGTARTIQGQKPQLDSAAFICSSELSSSIVEDKVATTILTDLYDRQYNVGEWRSLLKAETFELKNPTLSMFTATNEAHSTDFFAKKDIQGGYFARTFIVYENKPNRTNSLLVPLNNPPDYKTSAEYLREIAKLRGPFAPLATKEKTDDCCYELLDETGQAAYYSKAGVIYEEWYRDFKFAVTHQSNKDETGTLNRFGDSVLKVAMLLSLARSPELVITDVAMQEAISRCETLVGAVRRTTLGAKGLSQSSGLKSKVIQEIVGRQPHLITKTMLMRNIWMDYQTNTEFEELMSALDQAGIIKAKMLGNEVIYEMPDEEVERWVRFFGGKLNKV